ncbi:MULTISPECIES: nucleotide exchange factor GrpE [Persicobacter]|uniref:Protein GrpE n=1 Tax=Persicobacter diffluens TaxID=981 RepID=A0AAN4VTG6_9BACT|nr:nucleotide exchange factor GrpE [Persicobacter sp. CCB-QB2]GJM59676.1 protein GrpE [Persicobacter diffluens]
MAEHTVNEEEKNLQEEAVNEQQAEETAENTENTEENAAEANTEEAVSEEDKLKAEVQEHKDKYLRLYSEFENYRRRTSKEKLELVESANERLIKELLSVVDNFDRANANFKEDMDAKAVHEGSELIFKNFKTVLEKFGLKALETEKGDDFDTDMHDAITEIPVPEEDLKGKVFDVVEKGYKLNEKVIRFAKVVVGAK